MKTYILVTSTYQYNYVKLIFDSFKLIWPEEPFRVNNNSLCLPLLIEYNNGGGGKNLLASKSPSEYFMPTNPNTESLVMSFGQVCKKYLLTPYIFAEGDSVAFPLTKSFDKPLYECTTLKNKSHKKYQFINFGERKPPKSSASVDEFHILDLKYLIYNISSLIFLVVS